MTKKEEKTIKKLQSIRIKYKSDYKNRDYCAAFNRGIDRAIDVVSGIEK